MEMNLLLHFLSRIVVHRVMNELQQLNYCSNPVPGVQRLVLGIDVTQLDLKHDYSVDHNDGFRGRIVELTCNEGKIWTSPFDGIGYQVPDQVDTVSALPAGVLYSEILLHTHMESVRDSMSAEAGIDSTKGLFSASLSYKYSQFELTNSSTFVASSKAFVSTTQIDYVPGSFLNESLSRYTQALIRTLPDKYEENPGPYEQFIQTYGTHYYGSGYYGGTMMTTFDIQKAYYKSTSDEEVKLNAEATFFGILKAHGAYDGDVGMISEDFKSASHSTQRYYGGVANLFDKEGYSQWWPTIFKNPWLYGGKLFPITDLLPESTIKESLKLASTVHVRKAYLREIERSLLSYKEHAGDKTVEYLKQVGILLGKNVLSGTELESFGILVNSYLFTPIWFSAETLYCVQFAPDSAPQCGNIMKKAMGPPEGFFIDAITFTFGMDLSPHAPSWWAEVSIIKKETPDSASYMFEVPPNTPLWMLNTKLCFVFGPNSYCGIGNQWITIPYSKRNLNYFNANEYYVIFVAIN